jgi:hypothetical protein
MSEELRKLAELLRREAEVRQASINEKCAQVLCAATGLSLLRRKLGGLHV